MLGLLTPLVAETGPLLSKVVIEELYTHTGYCTSEQDPAAAVATLQVGLGCRIEHHSKMVEMQKRIISDTETNGPIFVFNELGGFEWSSLDFPRPWHERDSNPATMQEIILGNSVNAWVRDTPPSNGGGFFLQNGHMSLVGMFPTMESEETHMTLAFKQWIPMMSTLLGTATISDIFGSEDKGIRFAGKTPNTYWVDGFDATKNRYRGFVSTCESWCNRVVYPESTDMASTSLEYVVIKASDYDTESSNINAALSDKSVLVYITHTKRIDKMTLIITIAGSETTRVGSTLKYNYTTENVLAHVLPYCFTDGQNGGVVASALDRHFRYMDYSAMNSRQIEPPPIFNHARYGNTMTATAVIELSGVVQASGWLAAYADGDEVRGVQGVPTVPPFGPYQGVALYQIVIYGDESGDVIQLEFGGRARSLLAQQITFVPNGQMGSAVAPVVFTD